MGLVRAAVVALGLGLGLGLAACLKPDLVACGDRLCPVGAVCLPDGTCASQESVDACSGMPDGSPCTTSMFTGACRNGVCGAPMCGDGLVTGAEECDGPVTDIECADFGFDLGVPTCNARCDLDLINSCTRFGWHRVLSGTIREAAAVDPGKLAWINSSGTLAFQPETLPIDPGPWDHVAAGGGFFVASSDTDVARFDANAKVSLGVPAGTRFDHIAIDANGTAYGVVQVGCMVYAHAIGGTWTIIKSTNANDDCRGIAIDAADHSVLLAVIVSGSTGRVDRWNGTTWTNVMTRSEEVLVVAGRAGDVWAGTAFGGVFRLAGATMSHFASNDFVDELVVVGPYIYFSGSARLDGDFEERMAQPVTGELLSDGSKLYVAGNGIYELDEMIFAERGAYTVDVHDIIVATDGEPVAAAQNLIGSPAAYPFTWDATGTAISTQHITAASSQDAYATDGSSLIHFDGSGSTSIATPPTFTGINGLALSGTKLYAVGNAGLSMVRDTSWSTLSSGPTAGCDLHAITSTTAGIFACGVCAGAGALWQLSGSTWSELHRGGTSLDAIAVTSEGDVVAAGAMGGGRWSAGTWADDPRMQGQSISATTRKDIWIAGGPDDVIHWDGNVWSRLRVDGVSSPHVAATPHAVYFAGIQRSTLLR